MKCETIEKGFAIVVCDRGFIYVGDVESTDKKTVINRARNIRRWGTSWGLLQLAKEGPQSETKLDGDGTATIHVPAHSIIHIIETECSLWK